VSGTAIWWVTEPHYDEKSFFNLETKVGTSDNMFRRFSFEMKPELLKSGRGKDLKKLWGRCNVY
jgi:hypothetical protein